MADFDSYSDVTTLQTTDKLLLLRSGGGINVTLANLFANAPGNISSGLGVSTGDVSMDLGGLRSGDGAAYLDLHGQSGVGFNTRILRNGGVNGAFQITQTGTGDLHLYHSGAGIVRFSTSAVERMRITAGGNVGIGTTSPTAQLHVVNASDGADVLSLNGATGVMTMRPDGANGNVIRIGGTGPAASTLRFLVAADAERLRIEQAGHLRPGADNAYTLGTASYRWSVVYAATGTINTSDEREKEWRGAMNAAELRAARRMIDELGFFQWRQAVEEKGKDGARMHFGPRAQRVWAIMADEGLVDPIGKDGRPGKTTYAFLCFDEWADEYEDEMKLVIRKKKVPVEEASVILDPKGGRAKKTKMVTAEVEEMVPTGRKLLKQAAGNRFGLRVDQLTLFLMAAQAQRQSDIEARSIEQETAISALRDRLAALEAA